MSSKKTSVSDFGTNDGIGVTSCTFKERVKYDHKQEQVRYWFTLEINDNGVQRRARVVGHTSRREPTTQLVSNTTGPPSEFGSPLHKIATKCMDHILETTDEWSVLSTRFDEIVCHIATADCLSDLAQSRLIQLRVLTKI